jgi:glycosyltransferase involved in cell wall biosynthesis
MSIEPQLMAQAASLPFQARDHLEKTGCLPLRIVFDLTTITFWSGPPIGIVRVEFEFAKWALERLDNVVFGFFDPSTLTFRQLNSNFTRQLLAQKAFLDVRRLTDSRRARKRKTDRIPAAIRPYAMWLLQSRRMTLQTLQRTRLTTANPRVAWLAEAVQRAIVTEKYASMLRDDSGRTCFPIDMALGPPIEFEPGDLIICTGARWVHTEIEQIVLLKQNSGCCFALFWHDVIPLVFPEYFREFDVEQQRAYCNVAFPEADLVVFSSRSAEQDTRSYCTAHGIPLRATAICTLGANAAAVAPAERLPPGLEPGHYALLVSTIEPRKGHRLIHEVWKDLLASGIPQRARFKLVFAGREGWMVDELMSDLRTTSEVTGSLQVITNADDALLTLLYRHAAFCLFPSRYEGFGLPVVEAFFHGKPVLASTGGAVPEVVRDFSPCLDPNDAPQWRRELQSWIEDPAARAPYEERIRTSFRHPTWDESAQQFFAIVQNVATPSAVKIKSFDARNA